MQKYEIMIATTILTMTFWEFLKYYVILIAVFLPFSIVAVIRLNKKTDIIKRIDNYLDMKLYGQVIQNTAPAEPPLNNVTENKEQKDETDGTKRKDGQGTDTLQDMRESDESIGIAWFQMKVHDSYRCRINRETAEMFKNTVGQWCCQNGFVGRIENDKYFHADKAGRTYVLFGNDNENSACIYNIEVVPTNEEWEFQQAFDDVLSGKNISDVKSRMINTPLIRADFTNNLTIYRGENDVEKITYEHGAKGNVLRVLHTINGQNEDFIKSAAENLNERMREIENINSQNIRIWIHENENEYVDVISFLRKTSDGRTLLGIGKSWRVNGEKAEIELNLPMVEKTFIKCLDGIHLEDDNSTLEVINKEDDDSVKKSSTPDEPERSKNKRQATSRKKKTGPESESTEGAEEGVIDGGRREEKTLKTEETEGDRHDNDSGAPSNEPEEEDYSPDDDQNYY